jgi:tRNA threonylcarbamoyladenosine biosynthesis protein TsaE
MQLEWTGVEENQMDDVAATIIRQFPSQKKWLLTGTLGAGKTTLVKAFCHQLGISEGLASPSFGIVHEYAGPQKVFHFDLYRLRSVQELQEIGFEEYLDSPDWIFIEWPEIAKTALADEGFTEIIITGMNNTSRNINLVI